MKLSVVARAAVVVTVVGGLVGLVGPIATAGAATRKITVVGTGEVRGKPDVADLSIGVSGRGDTAVAALNTVNDRANKLLDVLRGAGVADDDIQTNGLSISPTFDEDNNITGYEAANLVTARIRDVSKAGGVIDAAADKAGDNLRVQGINFSIDDDSALLAKARAKAVKRARQQAEQLAEAAGVQVGDVVSINENFSSGPVYAVPAAAPAFAAGATPISTGTQTLSVTAQVVFTIR